MHPVSLARRRTRRRRRSPTTCVQLWTTIGAGSPDRYTLSPASLALRPGQSAAMEVVLRVLKDAARRRPRRPGSATSSTSG